MLVIRVDTEALEGFLDQLASLAESREKVWSLAIGYDPSDEGLRWKINDTVWGPPFNTSYAKSDAERIVTMRVNERVVLQSVIRADSDTELSIGAALESVAIVPGQNIRLLIARKKD